MFIILLRILGIYIFYKAAVEVKDYIHDQKNKR